MADADDRPCGNFGLARVPFHFAKPLDALVDVVKPDRLWREGTWDLEDVEEAQFSGVCGRHLRPEADEREVLELPEGDQDAELLELDGGGCAREQVRDVDSLGERLRV